MDRSANVHAENKTDGTVLWQTSICESWIETMMNFDSFGGYHHLHSAYTCGTNTVNGTCYNVMIYVCQHLG